MLLPKIDSALDVPPVIQTLRVYLSRDVLRISGLLFFQHRLGSSPADTCFCQRLIARWMSRRSFRRSGCTSAETCLESAVCSSSNTAWAPHPLIHASAKD